MKLIAYLHRELVVRHRARVLSRLFSKLLPSKSTVLDVGCGNGLIDLLIAERRPDVTILGIDVLVRPDALIPVQKSDGNCIPYDDNSVDIVMFIDVLHHTENPESLLKEALRVTRKKVLLKDHTLNGFAAYWTLRFMDWVGNAPHSVSLPYNYWPERQWLEVFQLMGVTLSFWLNNLGLYPPPANWLFERSLHFVAQLDLE